MNTLTSLLILCIFYKSINAQDPAPSETEYEFKTDNIAQGEYVFRFGTPGNQIIRQESGYFEDADGKDYIVKGLYSYIDPDGKAHIVSYYADKTGYHPTVFDDSGVQQPDADKNIQSIPETTFAIPPAIVGSLLG